MATGVAEASPKYGAGPAPLFVDTNILVYANCEEAPLHQAALRALTHAEDSNRAIWISRQILREFLAIRSRPQTFAAAATPQTLAQRVAFFEAGFHIAEDSADITAELLALLTEVPCGGKQVHDANIVATMRCHGIKRLLTRNVKDFQRFRNWITIEPLTE